MKLDLVIYVFVFINISGLQSCKKVIKKSELNKFENQQSVKSNLIYLSEDRLDKVKTLIKKKDGFFLEAYQQLIDQADKELDKSPNPVTNKTQLPPSGDKHDYLSIAPYRWPNPNTSDGSPWIVKDGEINPMT